MGAWRRGVGAVRDSILSGPLQVFRGGPVHSQGAKAGPRVSVTQLIAAFLTALGVWTSGGETPLCPPLPTSQGSVRACEERLWLLRVLAAWLTELP